MEIRTLRLSEIKTMPTFYAIAKARINSSKDHVYTCMWKGVKTKVIND